MNTEITDRPVDELEAALLELSVQDQKFHEQALRTVQTHREAAIPRLIKAIEDATAIATTGAKVENGLVFFSLALLTEFRAKEALPAILNALRLPGDGPYELFSDLIFELAPLTLAEFCANSIETIDEMILDRSLNEYFRWSLAGAYSHLVKSGRLTRDEAVERVRQLLRIAIENDDSDAVNACVMELHDFAHPDALIDIQVAVQRRLYDESIAGLDLIAKACKQGESHFQKYLNRRLKIEDLDTVEFLRPWSWPGDLPAAKPSARLISTPTTGLPRLSPDDIPNLTCAVNPPIPVAAKAPHVGRNDPCPCGSGKKFKKCCGAN